MSGGNKKRLWDNAVISLLRFPDIRAAAKASKVSEISLFRWLKDPDFLKMYKDAKQIAFNNAIANLQQSGSIAVDALIEIASDKKCPPSSRVSSARTILEMGIKAFENEELLSRIEDLEKLINERSK